MPSGSLDSKEQSSRQQKQIHLSSAVPCQSVYRCISFKPQTLFDRYRSQSTDEESELLRVGACTANKQSQIQEVHEEDVTLHLLPALRYV